MPQVQLPPLQPMPREHLTWATQQAIEAGYQHADANWRRIAFHAVKKCALELPRFSTNEVWEEINKSGATTHSKRALGSIMQAASRSGMIKKAGYVGSQLAHGSPVTLWRSNK